MKKGGIRYYIAKYSIYIFIFCSLFLAQRMILIYLFNVKEYVLFDKIYIYEPILAVVSFLEVRKWIFITKIE